MQSLQTDIVIIGAGLTGLCLHHFLKDRSLRIHIVEARPRVGGRIHTLRPETGPPVEMGATWLGAKHTRLFELLQSLQVEVFPQRLGKQAFYEWISTSPHQLVALPPNEEPSFRIQGGTGRLIETLAREVPPDQMSLGEPVEKICCDGKGLRVFTAQTCFETRVVVSTLPPNLLLQTVSVEPALPADLVGVMEKTHTWMGESIKVGLTFERPFWRAENRSGTVFSNVGPVSELYDHSSYEDDLHALKGFFNSTYASLTKAEREAMVLNQLRKYYGEKVVDHLGYHEAVWAQESYTYTPYISHVMPHQNNGHKIYRKPQLDGKLIIAGSETAPVFPGYMEGAVESALWTKSYLLNKFNLPPTAN